MTNRNKPQKLLNAYTGDTNTSCGTFENYAEAKDFLKDRPDIEKEHVPVSTDFDNNAYKYFSLK